MKRLTALLLALMLVTPLAYAGGVKETPMTVQADARYPLPAVLTLPEDGPVKAGLVLVHGSGPSDKDEHIAANHPFKDLAEGLSKRGFAVLRYDKRTFAFGKEMAASPDFKRLTVEEETVQDAAAAVKLLAARPEMQDKPVYLLGHSMGGMLASHIGKDLAEIKGYVLLAGTPRKLWQLVAEQNRMAIKEIPSALSRAAALLFVTQQEKAAERLSTLTDEEALKPIHNVFSISAWYLRHLEGIDAAKLHMADQKPVLVLQGESDRQVTMQDFALWQEALQGHPDVTFKSYPGLHHLFGAYTGEPLPFSALMQEYAERTPVDEQVIQDIAEWINKR